MYFIIFQSTGGRGYLQEVWLNYPNLDMNKLRETYNATYPVKSSLTVEYGAQDLSNVKKYQEKKKQANARFVQNSIFKFCGFAVIFIVNWLLFWFESIELNIWDGEMFEIERGLRIKFSQGKGKCQDRMMF